MRMYYVDSFRRHRIYKLKVKIGIALGAILIIVLIVMDMGDTYLEGYYPTLQQAFWRYQGNGGFRMREIIFIDEHEDSVTVRHRAGSTIRVSHFVRRVEGDEVFFKCVGITTGGIPLNSDQESIDQFHGLISRVNHFSGRPVRAEDLLYTNLHRRPLYGISTDPLIYNLRINGYAPDHVMVSTVRRANPRFGEEGDYTTIYFWYFADFDWSFADDGFDPKDIVITFD